MGDQAPHYLIFETAMGFCGIAWNGAGIACFRLPSESADAVERLLLRRHPRATPGAPPQHVADTVGSAQRYFEGRQTDFSDCRLDLGAQEPFFARVYDRVRRLRWGETTTYGAVAGEFGAEPQAAREVGEAMAKNPIPLIIPCHRVLAAGGKIGGFSAPGGSATKARMLELEGVRIAPPAPAQRTFGF